MRSCWITSRNEDVQETPGAFVKRVLLSSRGSGRGDRDRGEGESGKEKGGTHGEGRDGRGESGG